MTTVQQLKNKHKRRRAKERKQRIINGIVITVSSILIGLLVYASLCTWADNLDAHAEYNRNYIQEMEMNKAK